MKPLRLLAALLAPLLLLLLCLAGPARADEGPDPKAPIAVAPVDDAWRAALPRDAQLATQAYLDRLAPAAVQRANQYEEGGYWLQLAEFLLGLGVAALMLGGRRSARVRDWTQRVGRRPLFRDGLYGAVYGFSAAVLMLPLRFYQGHVREHAYGMSTQSVGAWWGEWAIGLGLEALGAALVVALLYAVIRRAGAHWWLWGTALCGGLLALLLLVHPVWIAPLFNTYTPLEPGPVRSAVLAMAQANGVPTAEVYTFDASRQTQRISANVSGLGSSAQVRLNDNLLKRTSLPEIRAVMGHELGHYVLNHGLKMLMQFTLLILFGFLFCQWALSRLFAHFGARWGTQAVGDVASLPLLAAVFSFFMLLATPVFNTIVRTQEIEADRFGLNLARDPHGFAEAMLKLADYRKPDPGALEEFVFFHHPSARHRIHDAMRWREAMGTP
ncbi:M48 family metallopeptidase [Inhella proteolytica]|uniref:M48 family metallopeptidase n=1 Tax=Inhella proteolytica TaxID=2795029 RepID=A0A931NJ55_9BURK|nr:M48 family metallopeptidase [Inhella proteolytica]MBH9578285.1 M48 family metallopeptidase [Inhella proteolytica]